RRLLIGSAATTTAWTATARAAATEPAKAESAARFALRRQHFVHLGLDRLPLLIRRAKLLFDAAHHALAHLRRIKVASASALALASGLAIVLILGKRAARAHRQYGDHHRETKSQSLHRSSLKMGSCAAASPRCLLFTPAPGGLQAANRTVARCRVGRARHGPARAV